ncbi:MAG TPA: hypothetical protein VGG10_16500 [Rhizomicrobium sp.]|jgi:tetratricopeptide (TPR) repeat protein
MAEIFDSILGQESGEESDATRASSPHPFAAALAADMSRHDPEVAAKTAAFLDEQTKVLEAQRHALEDDRIAFEAERTPRLIGVWLKTGFQIFAALVFTVLGAGAALMLIDAVNSRSVVVDIFKAPAALASRGLTGDVIAVGLLDELTRLQAATRVPGAKRDLKNDWANDIKVEIPDTGISLGEIGKLLHQRFGHDLHIGGDLVQTETGGLKLTVRGDGVLPKSFSGSDLDKLTTEAAEYVYGESQPMQFDAYLTNMSRNDDAIAFAKSHVAGASVSVQSNLLNEWALATIGKGGPHALVQALALYRQAVRIRPDFWTGYDNTMFAMSVSGDEEGAVRVGQQMIKVAGGRPGRAPEYLYDGYDQEVYDLQANRAEDLADVAATGGTGTIAVGSELLGVAILDAQLHEVDTARLRLTTTVWDSKLHRDAATAAFANALIGEEVGDFHGAAKAWDDFAVAYADPAISSGGNPGMCSAAPTYQRTGQPAKADAALAAPMKAAGISTYVDCYRFKGDVLDLRGDWKDAQAWYANAVKLGPDIPSGYYSWGMALVRHGDLAGAAAKFASANAAGPHWADPLEAWGEVLMLQNRSDLALPKFAEADKHAPNWGHLHLRWGEALFYAGKKDEAQKQFARAALLWLSPPDKAALEKFSGRQN